MNFENLVNQTIYSPTSAYEVQEVLGAGGFGVVLQCHKKRTDEIVALKIIREECCSELAKEEVVILTNLKEQGSEYYHIVSCHDVFMLGESICLEFEKLDISLYEYLEDNTLSLKEIRPILYQLIIALSFLESCDVVHTDMKSDNIMMVDQIRQPLKVKLIDFGLAITKPEEWQGEIRGTPWYIAPEVLLGAQFNHCIDTWALGCMAAEMLTGEPLFPGNNQLEMMQCILQGRGLPPNYVLSDGCYTDTLFYEKTTRQRAHIWSLKTGGMKRRFLNRMKSLKDILVVPPDTSEDDVVALEIDRLAFIDLVTRMLHMDPAERITPNQMLQHPFFTLSHLDPDHHQNYVELSVKLMEVCDYWSWGGENRSSCSSNRTANVGYGLNSGEYFNPVQEAFSGSSYNLRERKHKPNYFEDSQCDNSSGDPDYTPYPKRIKKKRIATNKVKAMVNLRNRKTKKVSRH